MQFKKFLSTLLIAGVMASTGTCAFASVPIDDVQSNLVVQQQVAPSQIKTVSGTNNDYWADYDAKFTFTASADVVYNNSLGRYTMSNITTSCPHVDTRNDVHVTTAEPTITMIDGGRHARITCQATIQNSTGYSEIVSVAMVVYCDATTGALSMLSF